MNHNNDGHLDQGSSSTSQPAEPKQQAAGRAKVKPHQLSLILRQVIVDRFRACHSTEEIAEELRIPARTVSDIVLAEALRRPPQPERGNSMPVLVRRQA